jgi:hypothetical protein
LRTQALVPEHQLFVAGCGVEAFQRLGAVALRDLLREPQELLLRESLGGCQSLVEIEIHRHLGVEEKERRSASGGAGVQGGYVVCHGGLWQCIR